MTTVAPAAMQACACAFCLSGSLRALLIEAVTPAFLKAAFIAGASNCTQRTDDFVSGSSTHTWTLAAFFVVFAEALATTNTARLAAESAMSARTVDLRKTLFKIVSLVGLTGGQYPPSCRIRRCKSSL